MEHLRLFMIAQVRIHGINVLEVGLISRESYVDMVLMPGRSLEPCLWFHMFLHDQLKATSLSISHGSKMNFLSVTPLLSQLIFLNRAI